MALVPYVPTSNKRHRSNDSWGGPLVPTYKANSQVVPMQISGNWRGRSSNMMMSRNNNYPRRSKWSTINTRSNPVYPRPEVKYLDTSYPPLAIANTGAVIAGINNITPGTGPNNRVGGQISVKSCYYQLYLQAATNSPPVGVRFILFWDRQSNGAAAVVTDILAVTPDSRYVTAPMNLDNRDRFVILADTRLTMSPQGDTARFITDFRRINQITTYNSTSNVPQTGSLGYLIVSDENPDVTNPTFQGTFRIRFMDN